MKYTTIFLILCIAFGALWMRNTYACVLFGLLLSLSLDIHAIWRNVLVLYFCKMRRRFKSKKLTETNEFKVVCLPIDVDANFQLTYGRLLRECGAGQLEFWIENYVYDALQRLNGNISVERYHMTYKHPIRVFETFGIVAEVLFWDDTSFYMKQTVVRYSDKKECATLVSTHRLSGVTASQVVDILGIELSTTRSVEPELVRKLREIDMDMYKSL